MDAAVVADRIAPYRRRLRRIVWLSLHPRRIPGRFRGRGREREKQRRRLLRLLPKGAVCAEIGTWRGDFAGAILIHRRPKQLYLVDPWEHRSEEQYEQAKFGGSQSGQEAMDALYESVVERFRPQIDSGQVLVKRARSVDAAASFSDESLDWVYIDGDHGYEAVKRDLEAYYRVVKSGGFIAGDDYGATNGWFGDGVARAVDEFAARCADVTIIGSQFLLTKP
jgi:hypothetical protein